MISARAFFGGVATLLLLSACQPPKYVRFISPYKDFVCEVPWGWAVYLDGAGSDYTSATFTGPLEPEFFRGTPSLSVRWYAYNAAHRMPGGTAESYRSTDDFTRQMLTDVYGPDGYIKAGGDFDQQRAASQGNLLPDISTITVSAASGAHYVVYRTIPAPKGANLGVVQDGKGGSVIRQRHAYVLVPMRGGFYVVTYPATREGFEKYKPAFFHLVNTFKLMKEGPAGPVWRGEAPSALMRR